MRAAGTIPRSRLDRAYEQLESLQWLSRVLVGKVTRRRALPDILTEDGFVQEMLHEARLLREQVKIAVGSKAFRERMLANTSINWRGANKGDRQRAVRALADMIQGLPTDFARGVRAVLDTQTNRIVDDTHRRLGARYKQVSVDPVFALKNEQAVAALSSSTSIFFGSEYRKQAGRFTARAQSTISRGLADGLGVGEIGRRLRDEFTDTAIHASYWETVAAVHVNRARSFSSMATFAGSGITQYEVLAVKDERTTEICVMMDGTIFSVEQAMGAFDAFEQATSLEEVRDRVAPFMRHQGDEIRTVGGTLVGTRGRSGWDRKDPEKLNEAGIHAPPYHFRCRTTILPVLESATVIPEPKSIEPPPTPKPKPKKPKPAPAEPAPPAPPAPAPKLPHGSLRDPVAEAKSRPAKRKAILDQIESGAGFIPGQFAAAEQRNEIFGRFSDRKNFETMREFNTQMAEAFLKKGRALLASDKEALRAWNAIVNTKPGRPSAMWKLNDAVNVMVAKLGKMGAESIPVAERAERRRKFVEEVKFKTKKGRLTRGGDYVQHTGAKGKLKKHELDRLEEWAGEFFDVWGPVAEAALKRNRQIINSTGRAHNNQSMQYFSYPNQRQTFFHEFGHSIEHHVNRPRESLSYTNHDSGEHGSYWRQRIETRDPNPAVQLSKLTRNSGYRSNEKSKKDRWGNYYMGKTYARGSTEVVSMMNEAFGGGPSVWRDQFRQDPDVILEFLGYMQAVIEGENTRRARIGESG